MIAVPSASKSDSGPSESVTRDVVTLRRPVPFCADLQIREIAEVVRMIRVRVGVAGRAWIEMPSRGGERRRLALADRVEVHAMAVRESTR